MIITTVLAESFLLGQYMKFFHDEFEGVKEHIDEDRNGFMFVPCLIAFLFKVFLSMLELKQGFLRILSLDVEKKMHVN